MRLIASLALLRGACLQSTAGKEVMLMSDFEILVIVLAIIELMILITKNNRT